MAEKIYKVGMYTRLSKEDGNEGESASIDTQRAIIKDFIQKKGWQLTKEYVDDGYSGTNFNRPDFLRMKRDIENKVINCVITKDLSRLGRNYIDCGYYMEMYFPQHDIRYIAINDGVDTLNNTGMDITPFKNILNEMYAQDISKKIKSAINIRFKEGNFKGAYAPYGYLKDPNNRNHLIVNEELRPIIRKIFDLALEGNGVRKIQRYLMDNKVFKPAYYQFLQGNKGFEKQAKTGMYNWTENSVRQILRSATYCGDLVGYKRVAISFKNKKRKSKKPSEWQVIEGTHEGIITREEFNLVQEMMDNRNHSDKKDGGYDNIFAGIVKCADCGKRMRATSPHRRKRPNVIDCVQYSCGSYASYGTKSCSSHMIEARTLYEVVLKDIRYYANMAVKDSSGLKEMQQKIKKTSSKELNSNQKALKKANKRLSELDDIISSLYEDKVLKRITERNFEKMSEKYQLEQKELIEQVQKLQEQVTKQEEKDKGAFDFVQEIKKYKGIDKLNARIINTLIKRIEISERYKTEDGKMKQDITIIYNLVGALNEVSYEIKPTKPYLTEKEKVCSECGKTFKTTSSVAKYCEKCRKIVRRRESNESKRRSRARARLEKEKVA